MMKSMYCVAPPGKLADLEQSVRLPIDFSLLGTQTSTPKRYMAYKSDSMRELI
jgi:hypothetical protein